MVSGYLFILHLLAAVYAYVKYHRSGEAAGVLAVGFVALVFAVGWTIATMLTNLLFTPDFFLRWYYHETSSFFLRILRKEFNRDTISLLLLTAGEVAFYALYLREENKPKKGDGKSGTGKTTVAGATSAETEM